ncbi:hypothetical protein NE865_08343 [Phthorimaea operculella]|nr:hypothetical protein NE865_08343 [Phthorimaea operculella]
MTKDQTIVTWLTKVEECAEIYDWDEREIIHFALPKLTGVAKTWYQGLSSVLYSWTEWKRKLIESFPCRQDYAELLSEMLAKQVRYGESLEQYYYTKINILNRCDITGRKAVDCLLHGVEDRSVRVGAQAASFRQPEDVLKYFKTIKYGKDAADKNSQDRKTPGNIKTRNETNGRKIAVNVKCYNCNDEGHKSFKCTKAPTKCGFCSKLGHLEAYCRTKQRGKVQTPEQHSEEKKPKQVALLNQSEDTNQKYVIGIQINGTPITCQVDQGSECTLMKESVAKQLQLSLNNDNLPMLKGLGDQLVQPLGLNDIGFTQAGEMVIELTDAEPVVYRPYRLSYGERTLSSLLAGRDQLMLEPVGIGEF